MFGNVILNTPLAIENSYLMALVPSLLAEYALVKSSGNYSCEDKKTALLSQLNKQSNHETDDRYPVVLNIRGPIVKYSSWYALGTQFYGRILKSFDENPKISGIVLNIDSGGGMVSGTAELTHIIKNLKTPTISYTDGYQCSAALDIASGCQYHMASPYADLIGSIGVMLSYQDFSAMFEKWGAKIYEIYAPQSTEKNIDFRELIKGNEALYTDRLKYLAEDFITRMKVNFGKNLKDDGHVFKGKTYTPQEALEIGLINELGSLEDALLKF